LPVVRGGAGVHPVSGHHGVQLQDGEKRLHRDPQAQYRNWMEPAAAVQLLERLVQRPTASSAANEFLVAGDERLGHWR